MTIGAYLLDLIQEAEDSKFNMLILGEDCIQDVAIAGQFFPSCDVYSAELLDDDLKQLFSMKISFDYIVVTYLIDKSERWKNLSTFSCLLKANGQMMIVCPNSNNIEKIADLMMNRVIRSGAEVKTNKDYKAKEELTDDSLIDIADHITELGFVIDKFGLFGNPIQADLNKKMLVKMLGDDYEDSINALFVPYIRMMLKKIDTFFEREDIFPDKKDGLSGFINEVNTFNMYNLVIRKNYQDRCFYMKNLDPVKKEVHFGNKANEVLKNKILEGRPFCALRLGNTEGILVDNYISNILEDKKEYSDFALEYAFNACGFFVPSDASPEIIIDYIDRFVQAQLEGFRNADIMMMWGACRMEAVIANHFVLSSCDNIDYFSLIPYVDDYEPWTSALAGKKVLVVTNVPDSVEYQYKRKDEISPYKESVLPDFTLITYRMMQTCQQDNNNYDSWFEALDKVTNDILAIDFDIAIVGAGFYGVPLCDAIKRSGRSAIEMCGLTAFMFGVAGKRFVEDEKDFYSKYMTDAWIRPFDEKPSWYSQVEGGCYW